MFPEGLIILVPFYPINLIVVYSLNENKPELLASIESVAKQLLIFLLGFWARALGNLALGNLVP